MMTISVSQIKARLSEYLRLVRSGEQVVILERGRPVARLTGVRTDEEGTALAELEREGLVRQASESLDQEFWKTRRPVDRDASLRRGIAQERGEGW